MAPLVAQLVKNPLAMWETWVQSVGWEEPLEKKMTKNDTPVFWPEEFHGQRSLAGYSPWGHKESDTTEQHSGKYEDYEIQKVRFVHSC